MAENTTTWVALISSGSVVISQIATLFFNSKNEKLKAKYKLHENSILKKIEVGEKFYFVSGENLQLMQAAIFNIQERSKLESYYNKKILSDSIENLNANFQKISSEKSMYSNVILYFNIKSTYKSISEADLKTTSLMLGFFELREKYQFASVEERDLLLAPIKEKEQEICNHYLSIISGIEEDMYIVQKEILQISLMPKNKGKRFWFF